KRHRIPIGVDADQIVAGDGARQARLQSKARMTGGGQQVQTLLSKAIDRSLMRGAMDPLIRDGAAPLGELLGEIDVIHEAPTGQEVALEILDPRLNLPFGPGAVGLAEPWLEAPVLGKGLEGGIPDDAALGRAVTDRARAIVQMLPGVTAEVLERLLVGIKK